MEVYYYVSLKMEKHMDKEDIYLVMVIITKDNYRIMKLMDWVNQYKMDLDMKEILEIIILMEKDR